MNRLETSGRMVPGGLVRGSVPEEGQDPPGAKEADILWGSSVADCRDRPPPATGVSVGGDLEKAIRTGRQRQA
jgi:hypothetical protein